MGEGRGVFVGIDIAESRNTDRGWRARWRGALYRRRRGVGREHASPGECIAAKHGRAHLATRHDQLATIGVGSYF